ncbi:hypothetical protein BHE74_00002949 [Ensete ventricosum]|nr:hypothetical protein BHE74_00002949 [Ensete ventricosum]
MMLSIRYVLLIQKSRTLDTTNQETKRKPTNRSVRKAFHKLGYLIRLRRRDAGVRRERPVSEGRGLACLRDTRHCWDFGRVGERGRRGESLFDGGRGNEGAGEWIRIGGWKEAIAMAEGERESNSRSLR